MARHRNQRTVQIMRHRLDEPGFTASCRALQHDRQALVEGRLEDLLLVSDGHVVGARRLHRHRFPFLRTASRKLIPEQIFGSSISAHYDTRRRISAVRKAERKSGPM